MTIILKGYDLPGEKNNNIVQKVWQLAWWCVLLDSLAFTTSRTNINITWKRRK
jgi:hypothetical protein